MKYECTYLLTYSPCFIPRQDVRQGARDQSFVWIQRCRWRRNTEATGARLAHVGRGKTVDWNPGYGGRSAGNSETLERSTRRSTPEARVLQGRE